MLHHHGPVLLFLLVSLSTALAFSPWSTRSLSSPSMRRLSSPHRPMRPFTTRTQSLHQTTRTIANIMDETQTQSSTSKTTEDDHVYRAQFNTTLTFPSYKKLMTLGTGGCVESNPFTVTTTDGSSSYDFCVKLYPRGGGHNSQPTALSQSGFGMSYRVLPMFGGPADEKVGVYLQFLPRGDNKQQQQQTVDATFALRILGRQLQGPRFNVEWRSGMRFVSLDESKLAEGRANDFGAHLMQTPLLANFLGVAVTGNDAEEAVVQAEENSQKPLQLQVEILIHRDTPLPLDENVTTAKNTRLLEDTAKDEEPPFKLSLFPKDIRGNHPNLHNPEQVRVGRIVVPILRSLSERPSMFEKGAYPGVEYRILRIIDPATEQDLFYSRAGVDYELKPIYPLVPQLERPWPIRVNEADIPKLYTPNMYNVVSAVGSLLTAVTGLVTAFLISQAISIFVIPSRSMDPTMQVGDVLLVDKVTPRLFGRSNQAGQVVLFQPTSELKDIVTRSGGRITDRDLFVKRIAAEPGSTFAVDPSGSVRINGAAPVERRDVCAAEPSRLIEKFIRATPAEEEGATVVPRGQVAVLGDCSSVSIDSRVWGTLPTKNIVGRPIVRLWPLSRFGPVQSLTTDWSD